MNPDCRDGKHRSCAGDGWNEEADAPAPCSCHCHTSSSNVTVQRASKMFAAENRTIVSADMASSRYVPTLAAHTIYGVGLLPWQFEFLGEAIPGWLDQWRNVANLTDALRPGGRRGSDRYSFTRPKPDDRTHPFNWAASRQPSPPGMDNLPSARMRLDMWTTDQQTDPRQRALAAKQRQGHGPPPTSSWRGKERNTK